MFKLIMIILGAWLAWRLFVMSWNYFRPVRAAVNTAATNGLNSLGLERMAADTSRLNDKIEAAVDRNININIKRILVLLAALVATFIALYWSSTLN